MMKRQFAFLTALLFAWTPICVLASPGGGARVSGQVTFSGSVGKLKPYDLSKEPVCAKLHASDPLYPDSLLTGPGNSLRNVVVYISAGAPPSGAVPPNPAVFDQLDCHYTTHVLVFRVGQEVRISNSDPLSHNIHPLAKVNREWNKIQPAGTPPFSYAYESPEFISVKCNIHPWMHGYFAVLNTAFYAITGDDGHFELPELPPGHYTVTAWHELLGTQTRDITVSASGEAQTVNFTFSANP